MRVRFNLNPDGQPHIHDHGIAESEVIEALAEPLEWIGGRDGTILVIGRTRAGRVLKIIHTEARNGDGIFIITAYELPPRQLAALRRRLRRKRS